MASFPAVATLLESKTIPLVWPPHLHPVRRAAMEPRWTGPQRSEIGLTCGLIAAAGDDEYAEIVALLEEIAGPPSAAALAAFLAPTEAHLVDRALRVELRQVAEDLLLASVSTVGEREHVVAYCGPQAWLCPRVYAPIVARIGAAATPMLTCCAGR